MRPYVVYVASAQDGRPYHLHLPEGILRLTEEEAQAISADLVRRLAAQRVFAQPIDGATPYAEAVGR